MLRELPTRPGQTPIHTRDARLQTESLEARRRLSRCEVWSADGVSGGFGEQSGGLKPLGSMRCAISQATKVGENAADLDSAASVTEYEITLYNRIVVSPSSRIFTPAHYPAWKRLTLYKRGDLVVTTNWVSGKTWVFRCIKGGVSGQTEPDWPGKLDAKKSDATVVWEVALQATVYEVVAVNSNESNLTETVIRVKEING